jgi:HlyD family secretion protein
MKPSNMNTVLERSADHRPFARLSYAAIAIVFGGFGLWAGLAPLDSAAVATAKVAAESDRKPIQHLEGGIVREILVTEAQHVEEGQVLFRLETTSAEANAELLRKQLDAGLALEARLLAEREQQDTLVFPHALLARRQVSETATAMADQQHQFIERRRNRGYQLGILQARVEQTTKDLVGKRRRLDALKVQLRSFSEELALVSGAAERGFYPLNKLRALERDKSRTDGDIGAAEGEIARLEETVEEAKLKIRQDEQSFRDDVDKELAEARGKLSDVREKLVIAEDVLRRIEVRAPRSGIVQGMKVHGVGAVVAPGATLAELVPVGDKLILTARVSPLDVQSVAPGNRAEVRFPAFSSRQAPTIFGQVVTVAADSTYDETTRETYFGARVVIDPTAIPADLAAKLVPGMPADVLVITGERTMLAYLVGPLRDSLTKSMRER